MNPSSDWLLPDWPAPDHVRACVTTRIGGVSLPPYASFNLGEHVDVGASGTVRVGTDADTMSWAGGPTLTLAPMKNANITFGYNFAGFHDRDFEDARYSRSGAYVTFKLKFDQTSFAGLGL